jgi:hypothetical protein
MVSPCSTFSCPTHLGMCTTDVTNNFHGCPSPHAHMHMQCILSTLVQPHCAPVPSLCPRHGTVDNGPNSLQKSIVAPRAGLMTRRVSGIATPQVSVIHITAPWASPVIAGTMAIVAMHSPSPIPIPTKGALPVPILAPLRFSARATCSIAVETVLAVQVAALLTHPSTPPLHGR